MNKILKRIYISKMLKFFLSFEINSKRLMKYIQVLNVIKTRYIVKRLIFQRRRFFWYKKHPTFIYYLAFQKQKNNFRLSLLDCFSRIKVSETAYSATHEPGRSGRSKFALQKTFEKFCSKLRKFFYLLCYKKRRGMLIGKKLFRSFNAPLQIYLFVLFKSRVHYFENFILYFLGRLVHSFTKRKLYYIRFGGYVYSSKLIFNLVRAKHRRRRKRRWSAKKRQKLYLRIKFQQLQWNYLCLFKYRLIKMKRYLTLINYRFAQIKKKLVVAQLYNKQKFNNKQKFFLFNNRNRLISLSILKKIYFVNTQRNII